LDSVDLDQEDIDGYCAFERAVQNGDVDTIKLFLDNGYYTLNLEDGKTATTPLIIAAENGNLKAAEYLLKIGAPIDQTNQEGMNALLRAICYDQFDMVKYLIEKGNASYLHTTHKGNTSIVLAAYQDVRSDIFHYLLDIFIHNNKLDIHTNIYGESLIYTASR